MASRKEEERNEKIIRGLMKLPPNRRCINCDSLGPQYVCTNFWTFVCITCSGIHREFTHRVKSVSMAKFTSQEVEALQYGGNQRARETYLQDWDLQRRRLPLSSNVDKIREFIKHVYVDKKYAGGKTAEKPPRDMQNPKSREDETRRASSYHSYSQSPPYDHQYEERIYGRSSVMLTRRSGSDKGGYEGKLSSLIYSPGQMSDEGYADRFHEASVSRYSDYSVSSGGDPIRSDTQSPNYQKESGYGSPTFLATRDTLRNADGFTHRQRTASAGSFGSIDSNSPTFKSYNSGGLTDVVSEPDQGTANPQDMSIPGNSGSIDLFNRPGAPNSASSAASTVDSFQLPAAVQPSTVDLFQPSSTSSSFQRSQSSPLPSLDFFGNIVPEQSASILDDVPAESALVRNEGWATFDTPQTTLFPAAVDNFNPKQGLSYEGDSFGKFDPYSSMESSLQRTLSHNSDFPSTIPKQWHDVLPNVEASLNTTSTLIWNAFEDSTAQLPSKPVNQGSELQLPKQELSSNDQYLWAGIPENSGEDVFHNTASLVIPAGPTMPPQSFMEPSYTPWLPVMGELQPPATNCKSINPFDFPYDSDLEQSNMFPDMSSLQDSLPSAPLPSSSLGVSQPWLPQNPAPPYSPAAGQGGLTYMAGQTPSSHIPNVPTQGPVASIGGNPFD